MNLKDLKNELLQDPKFRKEYNKENPKLDVALMIEEARIVRGITQKELAKKMNTKQSAISRAESGDYLPSLSFLEKMAKALDTKLIMPRFVFLEENQPIAIDKIIQMSPLVEVAKILNNGQSCLNSSSAITKLEQQI